MQPQRNNAASMSPEAWAQTERLAKRDGLTDAQIFGLAVGCPVHGNAYMDWDDDGLFCHACERVAMRHHDGRL